MILNISPSPMCFQVAAVLLPPPLGHHHVASGQVCGRRASSSSARRSSRSCHFPRRASAGCSRAHRARPSTPGWVASTASPPSARCPLRPPSAGGCLPPAPSCPACWCPLLAGRVAAPWSPGGSSWQSALGRRHRTGFVGSDPARPEELSWPPPGLLACNGSREEWSSS